MGKRKSNRIQRLFNRSTSTFFERSEGHTRPARPLHLMPKIEVILPASSDAEGTERPDQTSPADQMPPESNAEIVQDSPVLLPQEETSSDRK